jgi:hypothetical protein
MLIINMMEEWSAIAREGQGRGNWESSFLKEMSEHFEAVIRTECANLTAAKGVQGQSAGKSQ